MKKFQPALIIFLTSIVFICSAQQGKLNRQLSHLPLPVRTAILAHLNEAKLESVEQVTENGEKNYVVSMTRDGKERGFTLNSEGELLDEVVFLNELPPACQQAIRKQIGNAILGDIDKSMENGEPSYDVERIENGKTNNFTLNARGQLRAMEVSLIDLSAKLQTAIRKEAGADKVGEIEKFMNDGEASYYVEVTGKSHSRTVNFDPDGQLVSKSEEVDLSETPLAVQKQIKALADAGSLRQITRNVEDDETTYEVQVKNASGDKTVNVAPDGKIIADKEDN